MILKQNCFIISRDAETAVLNGTYKHKKKVVQRGLIFVPNEWGKDILLRLSAPVEIDLNNTTYTGSSLQRAKQKFFDKDVNESIVSLFNKDMDKCKKTLFNKCRPVPLSISHTFSKKSKIKIVNKINAWVRANRANNKKPIYNFITLTLTSKQIGSDKDFTKMQNTLFTYMRKYMGLKNYVYVLERQTKNTNNIHSHIIIDQYVNYQRLNRVWCKILSEHGYTFPSLNYVSGITENVSVSEALNRYDYVDVKKKIPRARYSGGYQYLCPKTLKYISPTREVNMPNPVDVETIYNIQAVSKYVTKYITKNESTINTSLWNCSTSISRLWTGAIVDPNIYYAPLLVYMHKQLTITIDNSFILVVNLLKHYTKIQEKIFSINNKILIT